MNKTKIPWVKNPDGSQGYTWNPITGCLNNCPYCYARKLANGRLKSRYLANKCIAPRKLMAHDVGGQHYEWLDDTPDLDPFYPRFWEDRLYHIPGGKPKGIFACDMSDLFGIGIPEEWTYRVITQMRGYPQHRFYLLTKQPQNLIKFLGGNITNTHKGYKRPNPLPNNVWAGVTVTNRQQAYGARDFLREVQATVKFLSLEPLLEHMDGWALGNVITLADWVIIGSQTKPYKPPRIEWVTEIVEACDKAGIPVFLKDSLWDLLYTNAWDNDIFWANDKAFLRQEMSICQPQQK